MSKNSGKTRKILRWLSYGLAIIIIALYATTWIPLPRETLQAYQQKSLSILIKDRHGYLLREVPLSGGLKSRWVKLDEISPHIIEATVCAEDKRFYLHPGFDPIAITRAAIQNMRNGKIVSGASTITQQVVRNVYHLDRSYRNKVLEIWYAARLEHMLSKQEILELYFNIIPYGNQVIGVEAASQLYLQKPAQHLSISESAFLAAIPQSPTNLNPYLGKNTLITRKNHILHEMLKEKTISKADHDSAINESIVLYTDKSPFKAGHFTDWVITKLPDNVKEKGGEVITTLDLPLQLEVQKILKNRLESLKKDNVTNGSVIVLDNRTGDVLVMVGSVDYFLPNVGQVNGALSLRQPGSSIKPFTYSIAFEQDYTPSTLFADIETHIADSKWDYTPANYDNLYHGPVLLRTALASSYNIPAVLTLEHIGIPALLVRLHALGIKSLNKDAANYGPGLTLGNGEVTLLEMTRAYKALANAGMYSKERIFINEPLAKSKYIMSSDIAYLITDVLSDPVARFPAFGRNGPLELPFPVAAKTGTTSDFRDNWVLGYSRDYTVGVWVGNFDGYPMKGVSGITGAGPIFKDVFMELYKDKEYPAPFDKPQNIVSQEVCSISGELPNKYCNSKKMEIFIYGKEPKNLCSIHRGYMIDKRNGLLASTQTPAEYVEEKVYTIYPPIFREWVEAQDIAQPPTQVSSAGSMETLLISFPKNGDVFRIDPALPATAQSIPLKAIVPHGIDKVKWKIDGKIITTNMSPFSYQMTLTPGNHTIELESETSGKILKSRTVYIDILTMDGE